MKKISIILSTIIVFGIIFVVIFANGKLKVHAVETNANNESATRDMIEYTRQQHPINVTLNKDTYQIECGDVLDITNIDMTVNSTDPIFSAFEDGSTNKTYDEVGVFHEKVIITNDYDVNKTFDITIKTVDTTPPELSGITDCKIVQDGKFRPLYGVVAKDLVDGDVSDSLTCTDFDTSKVGIQTLTITATDKSGNSASVDFKLIIAEKPAPPTIEVVPDITQGILAKIPTKYKQVVPYDGKSRAVSCWGDSLTQGYIADGNTNVTIDGITGPVETTALAKLSGLTVYNFGVWGEDSRAIAARQGGIKMYINNIIIPAKGSVSFPSIMGSDGSEIYPCRLGMYAPQAMAASFDACTIGGVIGKLTYDNNSESYIFTRATEGLEVAITQDTQIITANSVTRKDDILILEIGNNGGWNNDYITLINQYISMIEYSNCSYYLIIGDTDGAEEDRNDWDKALEAAFGDHFIRMRQYLVQNGMDDCGLTPTAVDLGMMEDGEVPDSLKSDWSHLNCYGYYSKGKAIYERGVQLGYWK